MRPTEVLKIKEIVKGGRSWHKRSRLLLQNWVCPFLHASTRSMEQQQTSPLDPHVFMLILTTGLSFPYLLD